MDEHTFFALCPLWIILGISLVLYLATRKTVDYSKFGGDVYRQQYRNAVRREARRRDREEGY